MVVIPVIAVLTRWTTGESLASANLWVQALNLWVAFVGGSLAARASRHLSLSTGTLLNLKGRKRDVVAAFTSAVATAVTALLAYASWELLLAESQAAHPITLAGGVPMWMMQIIMPVGFALMAIRLAWHGNREWRGRLLALGIVGASFALAAVPAGERDAVVWCGGALILGAVALGAPLYSALGGMAMLLFFGAPIPVSIAAVPAETFRIVADPTLACLPLFTLAGYFLAEGGASRRLVSVFNVLVGWLPGGVAATTVLVCAFFTTFTGASGVTILALGGLLLPVLEGAGYSRKFSIGLITASGSIGLLFPPSLPVILYGVASHVPITDLFIAGLVPGLLLVSLLVAYSVVHALRHGRPADRDAAPLSPLRAGWGPWLGSLLQAMRGAFFEIMLPVLILVGIFGGFVTIFEAAALTAAYAFVTEVVIHRDLSLREDVHKVMTECATLMGGVLIILGVALGFTNYLVDAEIPMVLSQWVAASVTNKIVFLLLLNVLLLVVGCLMDIYSAIIVVVPLITPIAAIFGIHPVHLGIIFLANLELGYLTPPVGINLFLASFRFKLPLTQVYRLAMPFLAIMAVGVLLITYVPQMTLWGIDTEAAVESPDFFEEDADDGLDLPSADEMQRMLDEDLGEPGAGDPAPIPELDMDAIMMELEEE
jgi:tripartite ATP-independent transporter DctM subunit